MIISFALRCLAIIVIDFVCNIMLDTVDTIFAT